MVKYSAVSIVFAADRSGFISSVCALSLSQFDATLNEMQRKVAQNTKNIKMHKIFFLALPSELFFNLTSFLYKL